MNLSNMNRKKMQYIELKEMTFHAYHGVMEQERKTGNTFTIDLELHTDLSRAIRTDQLEHTVDYAGIYRIVSEEMQITAYLLEHLAGRIVAHIKKDFPQITSVKIRIAKRRPPVGGEIKEAAVILVF
jgi:dihydroneopterin aldolase